MLYLASSIYVRWFSLCVFTLRPRLHEQIKRALFEETLTELLDTDSKFEQIKVVLFAHVNKA